MAAPQPVDDRTQSAIKISATRRAGRELAFPPKRTLSPVMRLSDSYILVVPIACDDMRCRRQIMSRSPVRML